MLDPAIGLVIGENGPLLLSAFTDGSHAPFVNGYPPSEPGYTVGFARSTDFGDTWINHDLARGPDANDLDPPTGTPFSSNWLTIQKRPYISVGGNGNIYLVGEDRDGYLSTSSNSSIWIATSTDAGETFTTTAVAYTTTDHVQYLYPSVAADPRDAQDYVYVAWAEYAGGDFTVMLAVSDDGGSSFDSPVALSDAISPPSSSQFVSPTCIVGLNGTLYVVWFEPDSSGDPDFPDQYVLRRVTDGGSTFTPSLMNDPQAVVQLLGLNGPTSLFTTLGCLNSLFVSPTCLENSDGEQAVLDYASLGVGRPACRASGDVYLAYVQEDSVFGVTPVDANVYVTVSHDSGATWSAPEMVNLDDPSPSGHNLADFGSPSEYLPAISTTDPGHVGVAFISARGDVTGSDSTPAISNQSYVPYITYQNDISDPNETFEPDIALEDVNGIDFRISLPRLTDDPNDFRFYERTVATDYIGMVGYGRTLQPAWVTLRNWALPDDGFGDWETERRDSYNRPGDILTARIEVFGAVPPDFDTDCDVDNNDFAKFAQCFGGANNPPAIGCPPGVDADLDHDGDVDTGDFALFGQCYGGSGEGCIGPEGGGSLRSSQPEENLPEGLPENPSLNDLEEWLKAYCDENSIPWT